MNKVALMINSVVDLDQRTEDQLYVYELYKGSKCIYVGQTGDLYNSITVHKSDKEFDSIKVQVCDKKDASIIEADSIVRLQPRLNCELPSTYKYITLKQFKQGFEGILYREATTSLNIVFNYNGSYWITSEDAEILKTALIAEIDAINERKLYNRLKSSSRIREIESGLRIIASHRSVFSKEKATSQQSVIADLIADEVKRINKIYGRS